MRTGRTIKRKLSSPETWSSGTMMQGVEGLPIRNLASSTGVAFKASSRNLWLNPMCRSFPSPWAGHWSEALPRAVAADR